ncbi:MAG: thiol-disulfide oxidoreductase [Cyanobacteria bacterium RYN_339]|nr:thiol-disulfide oxidoreductase [Cyanobacteria bacterium RYN_339]
MRLFVGLLAVSLLSGCAHAAVPTARPASALVAKSMSSFQDLDGRAVSLDQFSGQPVVLVFLGTHTPDVDAEIPNLLRLSAAYAPHHVAFVAAGEDASAEALQAFAQANQLTFPLWQDPAGLELAKRHMTQLPAHQFIDRSGKVLASKQGFMSRGELLEQLERLIK